jgi:hypothetical protein
MPPALKIDIFGGSLLLLVLCAIDEYFSALKPMELVYFFKTSTLPPAV